MVLENPIANVDDVNVLFDDDVAGQNAVVDPVAQTFLNGRCIGPGWTINVASQIVRFAADNTPKGSAMDALNQFNERGTIANLETHIQTEFALGAFASLDHLQRAGHVHGDGLLEVDVLSASDDGFQMLWMIIRRRSNHYGVHLFGGSHLLIGFGANKNLRRVNCRVALALLHIIEMFFGVVQLLL